jgi:hypothetical protein
MTKKVTVGRLSVGGVLLLVQAAADAAASATTKKTLAVTVGRIGTSVLDSV